jgi:hypothetical protein
MIPLLILAVCLLGDEETNPKGFETPSFRKAKLVDLKKTDRTREIDGEETTERTYLDEKARERFRTYVIQNNLYRYDLGVKGETARKTLLDRDGDGRFEVRLPFSEADEKVPAWLVKMATSPERILIRSRVAVLSNDPRRMQKTAFQRGNKGPALPVLALFFVEETETPDKEAQVNTSVAMAIVMERVRKKFDGKVFCIGYRFEPRGKRDLAQIVREMDRTIGSKVKKVPAFAIFTVQKGVNRKTHREYHRLKFQQRVAETITMRDEIDDFEERLTGAVRGFLRKLD